MFKWLKANRAKAALVAALIATGGAVGAGVGLEGSQYGGGKLGFVPPGYTGSGTGTTTGGTTTAPAVPVNTGLPTISGTAQDGQTLTEAHGIWTNPPLTFYNYDWSRCNAGGTSCVSTGGTAQAYALSAGDVGHTMRVAESACNAGGCSSSATSLPSDVVITGGGGAFQPGVCSPSPCTGPAYATNYTISYQDTSAAPYGTGTPKTISDPIAIYRPNNLSSSSQAPAVITTCTSVSGSPDWQAAAPLDKFVWVYMPSIMNGGAENTVCKYLKASTAWQGAGQTGANTCGVGGTDPCDLVPKFLKTLDAIECSGAPPCENVNPNEVFVSGASEGGQGAASFACDTRSSFRLAGVQVISDPLVSPARIDTGLPASFANNIPPNCPAMLGVGSHCYWDCVSVASNKSITWQWAYGTADNTWGGANYSCPTSPCSDSLDKGSWKSSGGNGPLPDYWYYGLPDLAKVLGSPMGCPSTGATTAPYGDTGKITTKIYTPCSNSSTPSQTAMETISINGGIHLVSDWPFGTGGFTQNATFHPSDGFSEPSTGWDFWTRYFK